MTQLQTLLTQDVHFRFDYVSTYGYKTSVLESQTLEMLQ